MGFRIGKRRFSFQPIPTNFWDATQILGQPWKVYHRDTAPKNYYVEGWTYKKRPIKEKVFIYLEGSPILYVYFDKTGKVEYTFIGGS